MSERAVQVYSTQRGGSTFLAYMLANKERAIAPGDISFFFRPNDESHKRTSCVCENRDCSIWADAKDSGEERFYDFLFDRGYEWIIDSSKTIDWYIDQKEYNENISIEDVIIFKSPSEHGHSFYKRTGQLNLPFYVDYYMRALANTENPTLVEYQDLAKNTIDTLSKVCGEIGMPYKANKEKFWTKEDWHTWGGSNSAMIHFFDKDSARFEMIVDDLKGNQNEEPSVLDHYREIYYSDSGDKIPKWGKSHIKSENGLLELYQYMQKLKV